jgi:putative ABC transport system substrate-binding protein
VKSAAAVLASDVALVEAESPADFDRAFQAIIRERPDALLPIADNLIFFASKRIVDFVVEQKIPSVFEFKQFVQIGGLISYGPSISEIWHRGAYYVDKILKGAKAGDIPVEQPTKFELAINLKAAKALGLTIPTLLLAIADEVIE